MESVKSVIGRILKELYAMQEYSIGKAILSRLRNSIGRDCVLCCKWTEKACKVKNKIKCEYGQGGIVRAVK